MGFAVGMGSGMQLLFACRRYSCMLVSTIRAEVSVEKFVQTAPLSNRKQRSRDHQPTKPAASPRALKQHENYRK